MNIHIVMCSNGEPYESVKKLTLDSVHKFSTNNIVVHDYNLDRIKECSWFEKIKDLPSIYKKGRRDGYYCAYKVVCVWDVYSKLGEKDVLFYLDSSQYYTEGFTENIDTLCEIALDKGIIAGSTGDNIHHIHFNLCHKIDVWKKVFPDCDPSILETPHILASWFLLSKNDVNTMFLNDWIKWCMYTDADFTDPLITEHFTGDQSIFNMLVYKYNFPVFFDKRRGHLINKDKNGVLRVINSSKDHTTLFSTPSQILSFKYTQDLTFHLRNSLQILYPKESTEGMTCVEIGSFEGRGSIMIHNHLCKHGHSKLFCIDPFDDTYVKGNEKMAFWDFACMGQYSRFKHNTRYLRNIVEMRGTSDSMIPGLENHSVDFCYIDGDHSPEQVYKDIVGMFDKMKHNGIVLFDDYLWKRNDIVTRHGIDRFLEEYKGKYELLFQNWQLAIRVHNVESEPSVET